MRGTLAIVCLALLVTAGCATEDDPKDSASQDAAPTSASAAPTESAPTEPATTDPAPTADLGALDGALREQSQWVLDHLAAEATGPTADEAEEHFSAEFLEEVPPDQLEPVFDTFRQGPQLTLTGVGEVQDHPGGGVGTQLTLTGEETVRVSVSVDGDGLIAGLRLQPGPPVDLPDLASWDQLDDELAALGGTTGIYVGDVVDAACQTVHITDEEPEPAPSGSVFKLIVLSALVDAVESGELSWDDELTITPELKSLPTGELQDREDGSTVPVQEAAALMISISDNTATDLLMNAVGPERLHATVARISDDPDRLTPLLTTRQFFQVGWNAPQVREQWASASTSERADLLHDLPEDLDALRSNPFAITDVVWPEGVGWFLTGEEICTTHAVLQEQAQTPAGEPVREILSANPGLPAPEAATYQGFKGGSAPGVLAYSFYLEGGQDDAGQVLVVQVAHERAILEGSFTELTQAALNLLVTS